MRCGCGKPRCNMRIWRSNDGHHEEIVRILGEERRPMHQITKPSQEFNPHPGLVKEVDELFDPWSALRPEDEGGG